MMKRPLLWAKSELRNLSLNNRFFSSNQLITMLELCDGNEQFINIMDKTKCVANSSQDWFLIFNQFAVDLYKNTN
ncbi:hypothetical protein [Psychromonas arctica]|uniref:hypothetical protein n=1 Tax=Psychromonas arctica TaxID=168275 RepID=UPI00048ED5FC|nr:hypothetical protein [Psychromonas arctica]